MTQNRKKRDTYHGLFYMGVMLNFFMIVFFLISFFMAEKLKNDPFENGLFFIGYILSLIFFLFLIISKFYNKKGKERLSYFGLFALSLNAFSISAYHLNLSMHVFSDFVPWADSFIVIIHICLLYLSVIKLIPQVFKIYFAFLIGVSAVFTLYQSLYLFPVLHFGLIGFFIIGLPTHLLVPPFILIGFTYYYLRFAVKNENEKFSFWGGVLLPICIAGIFCFKWYDTNRIIKEIQVESKEKKDSQLPHWVKFSQQWPTDWLGKKILESSLVYDAPFHRNILSSPRTSFGEVRKHDPLVGLGMMLFDEIDITKKERIKILESQFDSRHMAHRKLWRGHKLSTKEIFTNIKVYPDYRLAYAEKTISIKSHARWQSNQQEALYTFHLPEGSVVTSLSLWIDGKEEKSRLTTKGKADKAYKQIVGVERRDPALLHWQEGNRITVTVFPCTPKEDRKFKIGVTIPLEELDEKLILKNIYFQGPELINAEETTQIDFESDAELAGDLPFAFDKIDDNKYKKTGAYLPYWELKIQKTPLSQAPFVFNGKAYRIKPRANTLRSFTPKNIYLDINSEWKVDEIRLIVDKLSGKNVFVYTNEIISLNGYDQQLIEEVLLKKRFSLFPVGEIKDPENSLLISKSNLASPNLSDLKLSGFEIKLKEFFKNQKAKIKLFHLGNDLSPYLKTLKEFNVFQSYTGDMEDLSYFLSNNVFISNIPTQNEILLGQSDVSIICDENASLAESNAPDHLMRLYNYNLIMKRLGINYFNSNDYSTGELIDLANAAYVVSPISSLIVLETKKDYERFGIDENENSLKNASVSSSGSVPEPHEWALIILSLLVMTYLYYKDKIRGVFNLKF